MLVKTMRLILLLILFTLPQIAFSQKIKYNLYVVDSCAGKVEHELLYEIVKGKEKYIIADTLGTITLPDTGTYTIRLHMPDFYSLLTDSLTLKVNEFKVYSDTIAFKKLVECVGGMHSGFSGFCVCDMERANGYLVDFYPNGKKRIEGTFKEGHAVGKLTYYYSSGGIKEVHYYDMSGKGSIKKKLFYDKNGQQIKSK